MSIAQESVSSYQQQIQAIHGKRKKRQAVATACSVVGAVGFLLISLLITYCGFLYLDSLYPAGEQVLATFTAVNALCRPVMDLLLFGLQPWYIYP